MSKCLSFLLLCVTALLLPVAGQAATLIISPGTTIYVAGEHLQAPGGQITVQDGALMRVDAGSVTTTDLLQIDPGGEVRGCGMLYTVINNQGEIIADCGTGESLALDGVVTNAGAVRAIRGTTLDVSNEPFLNQGLLDLITGSGGLPGQFINTGSYYTSTNISPLGLTLSGGNFELSTFGLAMHRYQLSASESLDPPAWNPVGAPVEGADALIMMPESLGSSANQLFYRFEISDVPEAP